MVCKSLSRSFHALFFFMLLMTGNVTFAMDDWLDQPLNTAPSLGRTVGLPFLAGEESATAYPSYLSRNVDITNIQRNATNFPQTVVIHPYTVSSAPWVGVALKKVEADGTNTYIVIQDYDGRHLPGMPPPNSTRIPEIRAHYLFGNQNTAGTIVNEHYILDAMVQGTTTFPATFAGGNARYTGDVHLHNDGGPVTRVSPDNFALNLPNVGQPGVFWSALKETAGAQRRVATAHVFLSQAEKEDFVENLRQIRLGGHQITPRHIRDYFMARPEAWANDIFTAIRRFTPPDALRQFLVEAAGPAPLPAPLPAPTPILDPVHVSTPAATMKTATKRAVRKKVSRTSARKKTASTRKPKAARKTIRRPARRKASSLKRTRVAKGKRIRTPKRARSQRGPKRSRGRRKR
ncbi:MAG: hypothetical protein BGO67_03370 [Alphaproteobacteria bacterium 41-28]|nr:MAG: hypothetical protein BGO67_03370 [Alphaproteobacteria bacterium 41-28]